MIRKCFSVFVLLLVLSACSPTPRPQIATPVDSATPPPTMAPIKTPLQPKASSNFTPELMSGELEAAIDAQNLSPLSPVSLRFNRPMDPNSARPALLTYPWVPGDLRWEADNTTLKFIPKDGFSAVRQYQVFLSRDLKSADGESFSQPQHWQLQISAAPHVVGHSPPNSQLSERLPKIYLAFDRPMDLESLRSNLSVQPQVPFNLELQDETLTLHLERNLDPGRRYHFTLAGSAYDLQGIPLGEDYRWDYSLPELVSEMSGPEMSVTSIQPQLQPLQLTFNYSLDHESFGAAVKISTPEQGIVEGEWKWVNYQQVSFEPAGGYQYNTTYSITFDGDLLDTQGQPFPPPEPLVYDMPAILAYWPGGFDPVPPETSVMLQFAVPVDQERTQAAFQIEPVTEGSFRWDENRLQFIPDDPLRIANTYTVTLGTDAVDAQGKPLLEQPFSWTFKTQYTYSDSALNVSFGDYGPNGQVLDLDGRRAIQFLTNGKLASVDFELYRLSLAQFLDRYSSGFKGVAGYERVPISLEGASLQAQWQTETGGQGVGYENSVYETIIPQDVPAGLYVLNMQAGKGTAQLIVVLTRNTLVVKQVEDQLVAWVADINGAGFAGARVSVYARDGVLITQGRSDQDGVYRTRVGRDPQPLIVVAEDSQELSGHDIEGRDITVSGLSNEWSNGYNPWWGWWLAAPKSSKYAVYLQTDRPIYRPGQTVYFKAIARQDDDAQIDLPPQGTPLTLRVRDARDNVVQTFELATNEFGTANGEFQLAEGAMLGDYNLEAVLDGESHRQVFKVQDYRKPDYQVSISSDAAHYVQGDKIRVDVDASYFFGQPVVDGSVSIQRYELQPVYSYWGSPSSQDQPEYTWYLSGVESIRGRTDENGHYVFEGLQAQMSNIYSYGGYDYVDSLHEDTIGIEVTVDDGSHQTVSSFAIYTVANSPEKLLLEPDNWIQSTENPFTVNGNLTDLAGEPVAGRDLLLEVRGWAPKNNSYSIVYQSVSLETGLDGQASRQLNVPQAGSYQLRLSTKDSRGQEIYTNRWIYVTSPHKDSWASQFIDEIKISADRESYAPGDTAQLVIESSFDGPALLTFERGTTRRVQPVELTSPLTRVDVPVQADDAPNIFVTVNAYQAQDTSLGPEKQDIYQSLSDSELRTASVELKVPVTDKSLNISLQPDKESYAPRQQASFHIRVTDDQDRPVVAELSLALVDEAIFSLSEELSGPIADAFYSPRPNLVRTYDSLALSRYLWTGGMGGGGPESPVNPRSDFPDTAIWLPALVTDENGEATLSLDLPDSLTSWRLSAKAVTQDTQVGETFINITTQKEVIVRPILPRILTNGDQVLLSAMLHSYAAEPLDLVVSMIAGPADPASSQLPLMVSDPITQQVTLQPGEVRILGWNAQAIGEGQAAVTVSAQPVSGNPTLSDAVRLELAVLPLAVPDVSTQVGTFEGNFSTGIMIPEGVSGSSTVHIELSRSIAGSLLTGLEYLTGYPYGCVEQTMSRALPNAVIGRAFHQLGVGNPTLQADLPPMINAGLQRLYGYQHNDGGWGWWFDDQTDAYQTAWVVFGLSVTSQAGYEVDPLVIQRGAKWLQLNLSEMDLRTQAYALYSLAVAGYGDLEATRQLADQLIDLDTFSQAGLALALHELGAEAEARQVLDVLAESAVQREGFVYWPNNHEDGHYHEKTMSSSLRSTALALEAFVRIRPNHPLESGIVRWLMGQKGTQGWGSTNETSYTILALSDHLLNQEDLTADTEYSLQLNDQLLEEGTLGRGEPVVSLEIPASQFNSGINTLDIQQGGGGRLYYQISSRMLFPQAEIEPGGYIQVERTYLDPRSGKPLESAVPGELVKVDLKVKFPQNGYFIIVEDKLPGGLEALNERLNTTSHEASANEYDQEEYYHWQEYGYNNKEVRPDRVSFFISDVNPGTYTYSYLARATHAGTFTALPAEVYAMYDLSIWGRSGSSVLEVNTE